jgi:hypothetical protein
MCEFVSAADCLGLPLEAGLQFGIGGGENLDRDRAIQPRVARLVDLAEAACAER